jgi:hypothetical protein
MEDARSRPSRACIASARGSRSGYEIPDAGFADREPAPGPGWSRAEKLDRARPYNPFRRIVHVFEFGSTGVPTDQFATSGGCASRSSAYRVAAYQYIFYTQPPDRTAGTGYASAALPRVRIAAGGCRTGPADADRRHYRQRALEISQHCPSAGARLPACGSRIRATACPAATRNELAAAIGFP